MFVPRLISVLHLISFFPKNVKCWTAYPLSTSVARKRSKFKFERIRDFIHEQNHRTIEVRESSEPFNTIYKVWCCIHFKYSLLKLRKQMNFVRSALKVVKSCVCFRSHTFSIGCHSLERICVWRLLEIFQYAQSIRLKYFRETSDKHITKY